MIIKGIEYNLRLEVTNTHGDIIAERVFPDLESMSAFIDQTYALPEYEDAQGTFMLVEVVNGIPEESGRYVYELEPYLGLVEGEVDDILDDMERFFEEREKGAAAWNPHFYVHPEAVVEEGIVEKRHPLSDYAYICPSCLHEIEDCKCPFYPMYLVQIDRAILPIIRTLNWKGYRTQQSCGGHPDRAPGEQGSIVVSFDDKYNFEVPFPDGSVFLQEDQSLCFELPKGKTREELELYQANCLKKLQDWANQLPVLWDAD